jgi:cobalt-zinc-cadmium efflux system outer membrane protein
VRAALVALGLVACTPPVTADAEAFRERVEGRVGSRPIWNRGGPEERLIEETVRELLASPLDLDRAVKIALIHSPALQATYAELGVAQAELVEACRLANPRLAIGLGFPTSGGGPLVVQGGFSLGFASMLTQAARRRVGEAQREAVELAVTARVLDHVAEVKRAFVEAQAAEAVAALSTEGVALSELALADARERYRLHEFDEVAWLREEARHEDVLAEHADTHLDVTATRERLNRALGLWGSATAWRLAGSLRGLPAEESGLDQLETKAIAQRLDLAAAKRRTAALTEALAAAGDLGWLQALDGGAMVRREEGGEFVVGPAVDLALPIFDQDQGRIARLRSELLARRFETTNLAITIRSTVREQRDALVAARRRVIHLRETVVPLRERIAELAVGATVPPSKEALLAHRRAALSARIDLEKALAHYWTTRSGLELTLGGALP